MLNTSMGHIFNFLGNMCFRLNGGLDKLNNKSLLDRMAFVFWIAAYGYFDKETGKKLSRRKDS